MNGSMVGARIGSLHTNVAAIANSDPLFLFSAPACDGRELPKASANRQR